MDDEDDGGVLARAFRSPVRDVVEGDTPNPNYTEARPISPANKLLLDIYGRIPKDPQELYDETGRQAFGLSAKVRPPVQTVTKPFRNLFPGIYENPKEIAAEAASRSVPESENLKKVFPQVSRETLADINQQGTRQGNVDPSSYLALAPNPKGSDSAAKVMNPRNAQRIVDIATEAGKHPNLRDMDNWYVMDPVYQRMAQLFGPEEAKARFKFLQAMMGMASPGSEVTTEIPRGLAAHYLAHQGRFADFVKYGGNSAKMEGGTGIAMPGHPYHSTSQAGPMERYLDSGDLASSMKSPKVPNYITAHGVPETGFQTSHAVPDAHWSRLVGLGDARRGPSDIGSSASMPEMQDLWPWWQKQIAAKLGIEPVPAQARVWGAGSGKTGVSSPIGPSKLELLSDHIAKTAHRLGVSPETARDMILTGTAYRQGGMVHKDEGGAASQYRDPVRDVVEGDTVNPNYTEVRQSPDPREGPIQRALGFNEPLASRVPDAAATIMAGILGPRAPVRIPNPIRAYHGSPHDFDAFDLSKIGTGEGAQAYGHGLYFAEHEPVAKSYRDAGGTQALLNGKPISPENSTGNQWLDLELGQGGIFTGTKHLRSVYEKYPTAEPALGRAEQLEREGKLQFIPGKMYEVALHASPEQFLDWDKPQLAQSASEALQRAYREAQEKGGYPVPLSKEGTGQDFLASLGKALGKPESVSGVGTIRTTNPERAADALREAGIPGIRYLDQGSRGAGQGTSNYVVWSPEIIEILRKYGLAGATALPALHSLFGKDNKQARGGMVHKDEGGSAGKRLSDVDPAALAAHREQYGEDTNPQQIEPDPNRPEYTGQILDFKEHPWHHLFNWARQIPMSMGYTGAAEGAATMGALGHILKSVLNRGARGPAGARYAPTTPAPSTDMGPPLASLERARMSRALHDEPPLRVELHGKIPGDAEVREDGGRTGQFANPNVSPDKFDQSQLFNDGGFDYLETPRMHRTYEPRHAEPSENFEDRRDDSLPSPGSKRDLFYSIATHSMPEMDEASIRMLTRQKKHK